MTTKLDGRKDSISELYEPHVLAARQRFHDSDATLFVTGSSTDPRLLDRFLIEFCAMGVQMTEQVEQWILRAGQKTIEAGYVELGEALQRHAAHERDHHLMMIDDTRTLVALWNSLGRPELDADELLGQEATPGIRAYVDLHESVIAGPTPYAQLGIEYEIEMLSNSVGAPMLANVARLCGPERVKGLSFVRDHVELDVGHTEFNRRQLLALLAEHEHFGQSLGQAGSAALDAYGLFFHECVAAATVEA